MNSDLAVPFVHDHHASKTSQSILNDCCIRKVYHNALTAFKKGGSYFLLFSCLKLVVTLCYAIVLVDVFRRMNSVEQQQPQEQEHHGDRNLNFTSQKYTLFVFFAAWFFLTSSFLCTACILQGSMICVVTDVYEGRTSSFWTSLKMGWKNMLRIFCFRFFILTAFAVFFVVAAAFNFFFVKSQQDEHVLLDFNCYTEGAHLLLITYLAGVTAANAPMIAGSSPVIFAKGENDEQTSDPFLELSMQDTESIHTSSSCLTILGCIAEVTLLYIVCSGEDLFFSWWTCSLGVVACFISLSCAPLNIIMGTLMYHVLHEDNDDFVAPNLVRDHGRYCHTEDMSTLENNLLGILRMHYLKRPT